MENDLNKLIIYIQQKYNNLYELWKSNECYQAINQKNKLIKDINNDENILNTILNYRAFISSHEKYKQGYTKWEKENKGGLV